MSINRKKMLYALLGLVLVAQGGDYLYRHYVEAPRQARATRIDDLVKDVGKKTNDLKRARDAADQLAAWEKQSLPSDPEAARANYRAWLLGLVENAKFRSPNVDSGAAVDHKGMFQSLSFSVRGQATLGELTRFLYEFYNGNHLHQIRSLAITPIRNQGLLDLSIAVEALQLPGAENKDELNRGQSERLAFASLGDYRGIVNRDLFGVGGGLDPVSQTVLTGITATDGQPEAWFDLRADDKVVKLKKGQSLDVGQFQGTVVEIDGSEVVLESDGERWLLSIGEKLDDAFALPPEL